MSYDEAFCEYDTAESDGERAADHQKTLDVLWHVGNTYDIRLDHMALLCDVACLLVMEPVTFNSGESATDSAFALYIEIKPQGLTGS